MSELRTVLEFYRDLGIKELWLDSVPVGVGPAPVAPVVTAPAPALAPAPAPAPAPKKVIAIQDVILPPLAPENDTLEKIREDIGDCKRCRLHAGRTNIVFGSGNPLSPVVFVGEGPGQDEDEQGLPFVGKAGQLLTQMIDNTLSKEGYPHRRKDVYICNIVKCRPPGNRTPEKDEMEICGQFVFRQLLVIQPKVIVALGGTAAKGLLGVTEGVTKIRGNWFKWNGFPVMVTYHPSYLLRNPSPAPRREAWEDLKKAFHAAYD